MSSQLRYIAALAAAAAFAGCATTPPIGSSTWHAERISEIELAYENGEISTEAYLSLKSQTEETRAEYQENMRRRLRYRGFAGFPHHHHHYRHHYYPPRH